MVDPKIIFQDTLLIRGVEEKEFLMCREYENFDMKILVSKNMNISVGLFHFLWLYQYSCSLYALQ